MQKRTRRRSYGGSEKTATSPVPDQPNDICPRVLALFHAGIPLSSKTMRQPSFLTGSRAAASRQRTCWNAFVKSGDARAFTAPDLPARAAFNALLHIVVMKHAAAAWPASVG